MGGAWVELSALVFPVGNTHCTSCTSYLMYGRQYMSLVLMIDAVHNILETCMFKVGHFK